MNASRVTRAIAIASLINLAAAAPPQMRTAPRPVMVNPNAPRLPVHNPDPQGSAPPRSTIYLSRNHDIDWGR